LAAHRLLDQPHDHHQHAAAGPSGGDLADDRADIEASRSGGDSCSVADQRADDLRPGPAATTPATVLPRGPRLYCFNSEPEMLPPTPPAIN
jgi:hypothetical protein